MKPNFYLSTAIFLCMSVSAQAIDITGYAGLYTGILNGGTITVVNNIDAIAILGSLEIDQKTVVIQGVNQSTTITNGNMLLGNPLIYLNNGANLTLKNITLSNMGGIYTPIDENRTIITVDNVIFNNNDFTGTNSYRGNVFSMFGAQIKIDNSLFSNNDLYSNNQSAYGSALYLQNKTSSDISVTAFTNNTVTSSGNSSRNASGGAIYNVMNTANLGGVLNITSSVFDGNKAIASGEAQVRGGAIYTGTGTVLSLTDTNFSNNSVSGNNISVGAVAGGAIYANQATIDIKADSQNVLFSNNMQNSELNDIHMTSGSTINLNTKADRVISFEGSIFSQGNSTMNITGSGVVVFDNTVSNMTVNIQGGVVQLGKVGTTDPKNYFDNVILDFAGASNTILSSFDGVVNETVGNVQIKNANGTALYVDVSQTAADKHNIMADSDGNFNLGGINITADFTDANVHNLDIFNGAFLLPTINVDSIIVATNNHRYEAKGLGTNQISVQQLANLPPPSNNVLDGVLQDSLPSFSFTQDLSIDASLGPLKENLVVYGNNRTLSGTNDISAFITGGHNLNILGLEMTGFAGSATDNFYPRGAAIDNKNGGILNVHNSEFNLNHSNTLTAVLGDALGGAVFNSGAQNSTISNSHFEGNFVATGLDSKYGLGGAIFNSTIGSGSLTVNNSEFVANLAYAEAGNQSEALGGAIANDGGVLNINGSLFDKNLAYATSNHSGDAFGGAILNAHDGTINVTNSVFTSNQAQHSGEAYAVGGAIANGAIGFASGYSGGTVNVLKSTFDGNSVGKYDNSSLTKYAYGGAIYNGTTVALNLTDTSFINNKADGVNAYGGAIYNDAGDVKITATNSNVVFNNNTTNGTGNDIHSNAGTVTFDGGMNTYLNGGITGNATVNKNGTGALILSGDNNFDTFNLNTGVLFFRNLGAMTANNFVMKDNTIVSLLDGKPANINFGNLTLDGTIVLAIDADLQNGIMDKISATSVAGGGKFNVSMGKANVKTNQQNLSLDFADNTLKNSILFSNTTADISNVYKPYDVSYNAATGQFDYNRASGYNAIKPQIMAASVALLAGNYTNQLSVYDQALSVNPNKNPFWVKSFGESEDIDLNDGPNKVETEGYGTLIGANSSFASIGENWSQSHGAFVGYTGSKEKYDGIIIRQNGAVAGLNIIIAKDNFWTKGVLSIGFSDASSDDDKWTMLNTGVGIKTGYDITNRFGTITPALTISYTYMKAFNSHANNVKVEGGYANALQLKPELRWTMVGFKGYEPYLKTAFAWNIIDGRGFKADGESLPDLALDPYVEYGAGVEKSFGKWGMYFDVTGKNINRKGVALNLGANMTF